MATTEAQPLLSSLPDYPQMIMAAIEALGGSNGANKSAISKYIQSKYPNVPTAHSALLSLTLNKMKLTGQLSFSKNNYLKPDPNVPPKRGRGRPPKPKLPDPPPPGAPSSPCRPRGRPPKTKPPPSGRPRGRPPKSATAPPTLPVAGGVKRGRGRPPKVCPAPPPAAPVGA